MKGALFWKKQKTGVKCSLCPRGCLIPEGRTGFCRVRKNVRGVLHSLNYGRLCSVNADPIEKKPLSHFAPGTSCLSIATVGCNFACQYCQNWEISQAKEVFGEEFTPEQVVETAQTMGLPGIAYTYVEPTIFYEFALDTMKIAKKQGVYNVWVSNGYTSLEAIKRMSRYLDAINIDYKGDEKFYKKLCLVPDMEPIRKAMLLYKRKGVWLEITNLLVPGWNDKREQVEDMCRWIVKNLGPETPLHFSRFFPHYKMTDVPPTPSKTLDTAYETAKAAGLSYVYVGNVPGDRRESTFCPKCGALVIERLGFGAGKVNRKCPECGHKIPLAGLEWK
jgi:pyruvate formate lyase activating enzyme